MSYPNLPLKIDCIDHESIKSALSYLADVAREYEFDDPAYCQKILEFRQKQIEKINEAVGEILDAFYNTENYTDHVSR
jgi:hypothetical protein